MNSQVSCWKCGGHGMTGNGSMRFEDGKWRCSPTCERIAEGDPRHAEKAAPSTNDIPQAWAVKDYADGWIICDSETTAKKLADSLSDAKIVHLVASSLGKVTAEMVKEADEAVISQEQGTVEESSAWIANFLNERLAAQSLTKDK